MIIGKQPLPGDETDIPGDAPPSYDALDGVPPKSATRDEKPSSSSTHPRPSPSPKSSTSLGSSSGSGTGPAWFNFGPSARAAREVRTTLLGLLRDLVKQNDAAGALGVLESCADACRTYDLSLSALLQEQSVEGHTPLYWAIVNRPTHPDGPSPSTSTSTSTDEAGPDLVSALLAQAAPLKDATVDEIRLACLHTSDHAFFQGLRRSPAFSPLTGTEEILLGGSVPVDDVDVEDVKGDEGAFVVRFKVPLFQKRMRISGAVRLEFIAKGRLWELSFIVAKDDYDRRFGFRHVKAGSWGVRLALLPHSPPTCIDSRLVIEDPRARSPSHDPPPSPSSPYAGPPTSLLQAIMAGDDSTPPSPSSSSSSPSPSSTSSARPKPKPRVELRLQARAQLTSARWEREHSQIVVALEESALANSLQFNGCPYFEADGALVARLEAKLGPPGADCTIC